MVNKTSMLYWWPLTKDLKILQPLTGIALQKEAFDWIDILDKGLDEKEKQILYQHADAIGYPLFIRTDHSSTKHDFMKTCFVQKKEDLMQHIHDLFETNYCHGLYPEAIIFRKYIDLDWKFRAFNCLPIAPERRYFISNGEVVCHHPYWPENAIEFYNKDCPRPYKWQYELKSMNYETHKEIKLLKGYAKQIASVLDGEYSVDFAKGRDKQWYFIDAATAIQSWHPEETKDSQF